MQQFSNNEIVELRSRIDEIHELLAGRSGTAVPTVGDGGVATDPGASRAVLVNQLAFNIQIRRLRRHHFGSPQVSGPVWDMLLDLMLAASNGRILSASDLATGAGVPLSSGLRMIGSLETMGFVRRSTDERDRRRTIVRLTDHGTERMTSYFEKIGVALRNSSNLAA
ncbi:winged helix DNA-binding protein [Sphingopyxis sp. XHP0097]|uniref:Winged helix DNA-binding protein n=1 Tax=Sphingopyxis jiangsuensis TaxID=2871171 RepID=A0ABS7ME14_9SPHN|nr:MULTISPECIES: winged helix DNA-binding protein [Sphingopyxis]MBL0769603.1 winged helix DNA-binding protein [Sphingopyxis lutea]MBY4637268.1 winged helix DNA-binding protein [Sphingopyxis jiangsuensis]